MPFSCSLVGSSGSVSVVGTESAIGVDRPGGGVVGPRLFDVTSPRCRVDILRFSVIVDTEAVNAHERKASTFVKITWDDIRIHLRDYHMSGLPLTSLALLGPYRYLSTSSPKVRACWSSNLVPVLKANRDIPFS